MSDVIKRLHRERDALEIKTEKLCKFIASPRHSELPDFQREMLVAQYHAMQSYLHILKLRIADLMTPETAGGEE